MSYSAIVVDDERKIREGISGYINKLNCGFTVERSFEYANDAIDYLKEKDIDLVVTDIKMEDTSGIDLAEFIHKNCSDTKIIFISGYNEFAYAKSAMSNHVSYYLLKPIKNAELRGALKAIKEELDNEANIRSKIKKYDNVLKEIRELFVVDLVFGGLKDASEIERRMKLSEFDSPESMYFIIIRIKWQSESNVHDWPYGNENRANIVFNFFGLNKLCEECIPLSDDLYVILFRDDPGEKQVELFNKWAAETFGCEISVRSEYAAKGLEHLRDYMLSGSKSTSEKNNELFAEQTKMLNSYINFNMNEEACELFDNISETCSDEEIKKIFTTICKNAYRKDKQDENLYIDMLVKRHEPPKQIFRELLKDFGEVSSDDEHLMKQVKEYINTSYMDDISLESTADNVYLNSTYLSRLFKKQTGVNFSDYLFEVRMANAVRLLKKNKYSVKEIAAMVGYGNYKYFAGLFKNYTGYTPKNYCRAVFN
jgi:two-component system response regulator YesN